MFCRIVTGALPAHVVFEDADHIAFLDRSPVATGHVLLIPRRHVDSVYDLEPEAYAAIMARARALAGPIARAFDAPRTGLAIEGFGVAHAHVHLLPVRRGGDLDPCRARAANDRDLGEAADRLRAVLGTSGPLADGRPRRSGASDTERGR